MSAPAVHFILYVRDQRASAAFYSVVLARAPRLDVPGMTEIALGDGDGAAVLGLMPEAGIRRLLGDALPDPPSPEGRRARSSIYSSTIPARTTGARSPPARSSSAPSPIAIGDIGSPTASTPTDTSSPSRPCRGEST